MKGFTLIEILVSIAILALIGYIAIPNLHKFNNDQVATNLINNLVTNLRLAQTNAQSGVLCQDQTTADFWALTLTKSGFFLWSSCINPSTGNPKIQPSPAPLNLLPPALSFSYPFFVDPPPADYTQTCFIQFKGSQISSSTYCKTDSSLTTSDASLISVGRLSIAVNNSGALYKCVQIDLGGAINVADPVNGACPIPLLASASPSSSPPPPPTSPSPNPLDTGLVSYWKLDETSGTTVADSAGTNNGTANGTAITTGKINNGRNISLTTDYINIPNSTSLQIIGNLSIAFWLKFNSIGNSTSGFQMQLWKGSTVGGAESSYNFYFNPANDTMIWRIGNNSTVNAVGSVKTFTAGTWYHIVGLANGSQLQLYVNGALDSSANQTITPWANTDPLAIGNNGIGSGNGDDCNCIIDEIGIWSRALTATEVSNLYNSGAGLSLP